MLPRANLLIVQARRHLQMTRNLQEVSWHDFQMIFRKCYMGKLKLYCLIAMFESPKVGWLGIESSQLNRLQTLSAKSFPLENSIIAQSSMKYARGKINAEWWLYFLYSMKSKVRSWAQGPRIHMSAWHRPCATTSRYRIAIPKHSSEPRI